MKISINAGHTLSGVGSGAVGYINESKETRTIANKVIDLLKKQGHTVYNHTVNSASTVNESLKKIVDMVNGSDAELFVSIHLNSSKYKGKGYGTELYTYGGKVSKEALSIINNISALGFKNRGIKDGSHLYVIKNTKTKALLIEVCFVDNVEDVNNYLNNVNNIAKAIAEGITGVKIMNENNYLQEFEEAKELMIKLGVTDGSNPKASITREEVWTMLKRLYYNIKKGV